MVLGKPFLIVILCFVVKIILKNKTKKRIFAAALGH